VIFLNMLGICIWNMGVDVEMYKSNLHGSVSRVPKVEASNN
jgi:hypothetical protein